MGVNAVTTGAGYVGDLVSSIPVVGDAIVDGASALYTGADKVLGGVLPGGQDFAQGYLGNLYTSADKALGGYLPNVGGGAAAGGVGYTPQYVSAQRAFDALPGPGGAVPAQTGGLNGFFDKAGRVANIAKTGMSLYDLTRNTPEAQNQRSYNRIIQPGMGGSAQMVPQETRTATSSDPVMGDAPIGGGDVPTTPGGITDFNKDVEKVLEDIKAFEGDKSATTTAAEETLDQKIPTNPIKPRRGNTKFGKRSRR
ncbi:MAG: hypothetical protein CMC82_02470 [Flavobacteriaceae bacterium]|nr:hypothetical protein [Flavobacteriaceae bacterium]